MMSYYHSESCIFCFSGVCEIVLCVVACIYYCDVTFIHVM